MTALTENWTFLQTNPNQYDSPSKLENNLKWLPGIVPGTVAQSLHQENLWSVDDKVDFDANDYWYRTHFLYDATNENSTFLKFSGLATLAEVWLNGHNILSSQNMFVEHLVEVTDHLTENNELVICFRALKEALSQRRPRPGWKTKVVADQQIRWFRTSLLGRIPGWTPPVAPVGPWKSIELIDNPHPLNISLQSELDDTLGKVFFSCDIAKEECKGIEISLSVGEHKTRLTASQKNGLCHFSGELSISNAQIWWPHTHGRPSLYDVSLDIITDDKSYQIKLTPIGFKNITVDQTGNGFDVYVNNKRVFCRGACWTVNDIAALSGNEAALKQTLQLMQHAGANMIRVGGTMLYEQDAFYRYCDQLGILVWQDFMFANMHYPFEDEAFYDSVGQEISQQLTRLSKHVSVSVYCGNSEIEQQTAMLGLQQGEVQNAFFTEHLKGLCEKLHPGTLYVPSTPTGGTLPFHTNSGVSHYYGIGAYLRNISELRSHDVRFTTECLGFANIPVSQTRNSVLNGQLPVTHHPKWKERTPRDTGTGWDFEDVRDHYLQEMYDVHPTKLRSFDPEMYMRLSELVTGEMMSQVFSEWRSVGSRCQGGLVWFLKDFWPGAGWGIIDSQGLPKACYYSLKRVWQAVQVLITNETLNGLNLHLLNESQLDFDGKLEVTLFNADSVSIVTRQLPVSIKSGNESLYQLDDLLETFYDTSYVYRFGPLKHSLVAAVLTDKDGVEVSTAYFSTQNKIPQKVDNNRLTASVVDASDDECLLEISSGKLLYGVSVDMPGFLPDDNFFLVLPDKPRLIKMCATQSGLKQKGYVTAINISEEVRIKININR